MFKKLNLMVSLTGLLALLLASQGWSQQQVPSASPKIPVSRKAARLYNPQAVETLTGKVEAVNRIASRRPGRPERVMMLLRTDKGTVKVHLGPANYLDSQALRLAPGDQVQVKGMRVSHPKVTIFIAGAVTKGDQVLKLRNDATGRPLWATGRKPNHT
jgi:hypothetical protein